MSGYRLVVALLLFFLQINRIQACNCGGSPGHIQHEFCNSDFAARVEVKGRRIIQGKLVYLTNLTEEFRKKDLKKGTPLYLTTPTSVQDCGVLDLKEKTEYLIMGQIDKEPSGNVYWFDDCNYFSLWSSVDKTCVAGSLKYGEYLKNCKVCQVSLCYGDKTCYPPPVGRGCDDFLYENHRDVCEFDGHSQCRWVLC